MKIFHVYVNIMIFVSYFRNLFVATLLFYLYFMIYFNPFNVSSTFIDGVILDLLVRQR